MNKFKIGDRIILLKMKDKLPYFTEGKTYVVGGRWHELEDEFYLGIIENDLGLSDGFSFDLADFALAQEYYNEREMKKLLGVK